MSSKNDVKRKYGHFHIGNYAKIVKNTLFTSRARRRAGARVNVREGFFLFLMHFKRKFISGELPWTQISLKTRTYCTSNTIIVDSKTIELIDY